MVGGFKDLEGVIDYDGNGVELLKEIRKELMCWNEETKEE